MTTRKRKQEAEDEELQALPSDGSEEEEEEYEDSEGGESEGGEESEASEEAEYESEPLAEEEAPKDQGRPPATKKRKTAADAVEKNGTVEEAGDSISGDEEDGEGEEVEETPAPVSAEQTDKASTPADVAEVTKITGESTSKEGGTVETEE